MKIRIDYKLIVFLYAYFRQIDLSLDRARWGPWDGLREYFRTQNQPLDVANALLKTANLPIPDVPMLLLAKKPTFSTHINSLYGRVFQGKYFLTDVEILYCYQVLCELDAQLRTQFVKYPLEAEKLRLKVASFYDFILGPKLSRKLLKRAEMVEHFLQNERLKVTPMHNFQL